jgi:hypothetical protein
MPFVYAGLINLGIGWQYAVKLVPLLCDLGTVCLIGYLAPREQAGMVRLLYALSPAAILVTAQHGQIEPIAVMLCLAALLCARSQRPASSGFFLALAVAAKSWPILFAPGVLTELRPRKWPRVGAAFVAVLLVVLAAVPIILHAPLGPMVRSIVSYRSFIGTYGWTGVARLLGFAGTGYGGPHVDAFQRAGTALTAFAMAGLFLAFRREDGARLTAILLLGFLIVTAGFGGQYVLWPVALVLARLMPRAWPFYVMSGAFAGVFYFIAWIAPNTTLGTAVPAQVAASVLLIATAIVAIPWRLRTTQGSRSRSASWTAP